MIRYFGGTKLGKSRLLEAYGNGAQLSIESAKFTSNKIVQFVQYPILSQETLLPIIIDILDRQSVNIYGVLKFCLP